MKADSVKRLMERGYRVKCVALPSSRKQDAEHEDLGAVLSTLMELLEDVALVESGPLLERKQAYAILRHVKFGPSKKGGVKKVKDVNARPTKGPEEGPAETDTEAEDGVFSDEDAPKYYSEPTRQRHGSEAPVKISPSITPEPLLASENRYKRPGPVNNNFRPPFRPEQQFPSDRNQQRQSDLNIPPPPTGVRRQDPSTPSTKASGFGIFSSGKPGGASEDNTSSSNNVVNRYGGGRRF
ncbi:Translation initiation factor IF3-1, mitochondrial [Linum grandiflorum]